MERIKYYSNPILISATYLNSQQKDYPVQAITYKSVAAEHGTSRYESLKPYVYF